MTTRSPISWKKLLLTMGLLAVAAVAIGLYGSYRSRMKKMERCARNLKEIALAMDHYRLYNRGRLPPVAVFDRDGKPLLSWRVLLLPYIEEIVLFEKFKLDEPWDSPHNLALMKDMPRQYARQSSGTKWPTSTHYQVVAGPGGLFEGKRGLVVNEETIQDDPARTLLVVEAKNAVPWTKPEDVPFPAEEIRSQLGGEFEGFFVAFADGSVAYINQEVTDESIRAAITRSGDEIVDWNSR